MKKTILLFGLVLIISCKKNNVESRFSFINSATIVIDTVPDILYSDKDFFDYKVTKGNNLVLYFYKKYDDSNNVDEEYWIRLLMEFSSGQIPNEEFEFTSSNVKSFITHSSFDQEYNLYPKSGKMILEKSGNNQIIINVTKELLAVNDMFEIVLLEEGAYIVKKDFIQDTE